MSVVAAMLLSSSAFAAGVNLAWTTCYGEGAAVTNKAFACAVNTGTNQMVTSFILDAPVPQVNGIEIVIDVLTTTDPLPAWWTMKEVGTCRQTSLSMSTSGNVNDVVCVDWAAGQATGGLGRFSADATTSIDPLLLSRHARLKAVSAVPGSALQDLVAATEYFAANFLINNLKSTGAGLCAGCADPVCLVFNSIKLTTSPGGINDITLGSAAAPGTNIITWQGTGPNCLAVPTRNATWGSVKALYR
jgi:hypothetical protein